MRPKYQLLLLTLLAVVAYLPGLKAGYFVFDDSGIVFALQDRSFKFTGLFSGATGTYWRPLVIATYFLDAILWNLDSSIMHLENVALHVLNTLLVFASARMILPDDRHDFPLLVATLFCLHPINTEAVNWISGRTDPLAAIFCLAGICFLLRWQKNPRKIANCYAAGLCIFIGCLAKEVAFGLFAGAFFFCLAVYTDKHLPLHRHRRGNLLFTIIPFILFPVFYLKLRALVFSVNDHGIEQVVGRALDLPWLTQFQNTLTSLGFYIKKLFIPSPLAFAIGNVPGVYLWLGIATLLLTLVLLVCRREQAALLLMMLAVIAPALINAVHKIAWTAHAERYLYLPAALFVLVICSVVKRSDHPRRIRAILLLVLLFYYFPVTIQRNLLWADQTGFLQLAVEQAPDNVELRNNYGVVLATFGRLEEARRQFGIAASLDPNNELVKINQMKYRVQEPPDKEVAE